MLFHIQYKGPAGWQSIGSGEGEEEGAGGLRRAVDDLASLAGGLEPGMYRAIPAKGGTTRWLTFTIGADGSFLEDEGLAEPGDRE
ncbi:MAG: hypothetical protein JSS68_02415 [Actinobacteria bacterium]|nr:hypothetical protein [Actinomycetota bacterium]MBS1884888.1 hypothetical protein [Actinomycetota bacterium]